MLRSDLAAPLSGKRGRLGVMFPKRFVVYETTHAKTATSTSRLPGASICAVPLSQPFPGKNYFYNKLLLFDDSDKFPRTLSVIVVN